MKAGVVCFMIAYKALLNLGYKPAADVFMQTVVEEECTGKSPLC